MIDFAIDFKLRPGAAEELNLLFLHLLHKSLSTSEGRNVDVVERVLIAFADLDSFVEVLGHIKHFDWESVQPDVVLLTIMLHHDFEILFTALVHLEKFARIRFT